MSDLINKKAVIKNIEHIHISATGIRSGKGFLSKCMNEYKEMVLGVIRDQPTIEAVPVVRAEWRFDISGAGHYYCSRCNGRGDFYGKYNFCPNCGADMRKGGA